MLKVSKCCMRVCTSQELASVQTDFALFASPQIGPVNFLWFVEVMSQNLIGGHKIKIMAVRGKR